MLRASISWRKRASPAAVVVPAVAEDVFFPGSGFPSMVGRWFYEKENGVTSRREVRLRRRSGVVGFGVLTSNFYSNVPGWPSPGEGEQ